MAYLNTRGTLVRDRLDFYESSNCWGFIEGSVPSGFVAAYLLNNASSALQLDVYGMQWFSSSSAPWAVLVTQPVQTITPLAASAAEIHCVQPDLPQPSGAVGLATAFTPFIYHYVLRQNGGAQSGSLDIGYSTPHIVLPPGWFIVVSGSPAAACTISVTFFYQAVLDNVPPAQ